MGILNKPVREQTCLRLLLWFASQLMLPLRPRPRLTLLFFMEDMDMVDLDMLVLGILVLAIMARDLLMLNLKPRLMQGSFMVDMVVLDTLLLDMVVLAILVLAIMARDLLMLNL